MAKLKVGIIGCGGVARKRHMPSLARLKDLCEMVAFCDVLKEKALEAARDFGTADAKVYTDYRDLLSNKDVDVVHVCTPNSYHCQVVVDAFQAGKHVMCEKPIAVASQEATKMMEAWQKSGKKFSILYQNRFRPEIQMLKRCIESGELGEIYFAKAHAVRRRAVPTWGVFLDREKQGGGALIDIGSHALDLAFWLMDNYAVHSVSGVTFQKLGKLPEAIDGNLWGPWDYEKFNVEDSAFALIRLKDGSLIYLEASWALNVLESREASVTLCGTKAGAEVRSGMSYSVDTVVFNRGKAGMLTEETLSPKIRVPHLEEREERPELKQIRQWIEAIIEDREPLVRPHEAFTVTKVVEAIYNSAREGKEVILDS